MSISKRTEAQTIAAVKQMQVGRQGRGCGSRGWVSAARDLCLEVEVRGRGVSDAQEAKRLRDENSRLRKPVADLSLDKEALQSVIEKNGWSSQR